MNILQLENVQLREQNRWLINTKLANIVAANTITAMCTFAVDAAINVVVVECGKKEKCLQCCCKMRIYVEFAMIVK